MALKNRHVVSHNATFDSRNGIHTTESPPKKPAQGGRGLWQGGLNPPDPSSFEPLSEPPRALPHTTGARIRHRTGTILLRSNAPSSVHASTKPGSNCPILPFDGTGAMSVCTQQARFLVGTQGPVNGLWFGRCTTLTYKMKCLWSTHTKTDGTGVFYVQFRPWGHVLGLVCVSMPPPPSEQAEKNHENRFASWFLQKTGLWHSPHQRAPPNS